MTEPRVNLPGSSRAPIGNAQALGPVDANERIESTLVLRRRAESSRRRGRRRALTRQELAEQHGATPADIAAVRTAVAGAGVEVARRRSGLAADPGARPGRRAVTAVRHVAADRARRSATARSRTATAGARGCRPRSATSWSRVLGLDDRPQARTPAARGRRRTSRYTPLQLGQGLRHAADTDGAGQTIAIIELGGGLRQSDLDTYFGGLGLSAPTVTAVGVDGATNVPGKDPQGADGEVLLDIEVAGAIAPGRRIARLLRAEHRRRLPRRGHRRPRTPTRRPTAMSISWGQSEDQWTAQARTAMDQAFADAAALGVTVTAAAGDNGSGDSDDRRQRRTSTSRRPARTCSACGGTSLHADPTTGAVRARRSGTTGRSGGATGGGVSDAFPLPTWQKTAGVPARRRTAAGRGVPDVAGDADPQTGYQVRVDGSRHGRSAARAPSRRCGRRWSPAGRRRSARTLGLLQPTLYAGAAGAGRRRASATSPPAATAPTRPRPGWDACTGLGVPDGVALLAALRPRA